MFRKPFFLVFLALVLGLVLTSIVRAELLAHWKFDEGSGNILEDSSGNGHDGVISGTPVWGAGPLGLALDNRTTTSGTEVPNFDITGGTGSCTLTFWTNWDGFDETQHILTKSNGWDDTHMLQVEIKGRATETDDRRDHLIWVHRGDTQYPLHKVPVDEWAHHGLAYDGDNRTITSYLNGELAVESPSGMGQDIDSTILIGMAIETARLYKGWLDDMQLHSGVLSHGEITGIMSGTGEGKHIAYGPNPADGTLHKDTWINLGWRAGDLAVSHDVYLGDNFDDVKDATTTSPTFAGNQTSTTLLVGFPGFPYPDGLVPGTTYYWRVDEVNDAEPNSPWKGDIWSFSIPPKTAYNPDPADGAEFVTLDTTFSWTPGYGAKLHTVYMGTDYDAVNDASGGAPKGTADYKPASLDAEKVYYWRVDEFDAVETHKGDVWGFTTPGAAGSMEPANGAVDVQMNSQLTWIPATTATSHDVYFGTDKDAVRNATTASPEYKGNKASDSESYDPGKLAWNIDYYSRIDAVYNTGTVKGLIWSFTTADFITVDDFESYNDLDPPDEASNRIFDNWIDGFGTTDNGALVGNDLPPYAEQSIVHGGAQSMIFRYDNAGKTSEATLTLTYPRDWTEEGVSKLSLWYRGGTANSADKMYVALNGNAVVYHDYTDATQKTGWRRWVIDLTAFTGVNLTNVNTITIGIGTKGSPAAGGTGTMHFDDIRLYR